MEYLPDSIVYTRGNARLGPFMEQRLRWREYDSAASLMRAGFGGLVYTLGVSLMVFMAAFILPLMALWPVLNPGLPLLVQRFLPWWSIWWLAAAMLLLGPLADLARYLAPWARMRSSRKRTGGVRDRDMSPYLMGLIPVLFILRLLTIPYYIYRLARPRRSGVFSTPRD